MLSAAADTVAMTLRKMVQFKHVRAFKFLYVQYIFVLVLIVFFRANGIFVVNLLPFKEKTSPIGQKYFVQPLV